MAAGQSAVLGTDVLILEKMKQPGRKLCITGKGRCNITNIAEINDFIDHFGKTGKFLHQSFSRFFTPDLMDFFEGLGLKLVTERGGRVFPASGKAPDVLAVLLEWTRGCNVKIKNSSPVEKLLIANNRITGLVTCGHEYKCDAIIVTTGGASYPATGSSGDGYRMAAAAGHTIVPVRPALVPLETVGKTASAMAGLGLRNINAKLLINGKKRQEQFGELSFTDFGVTGPVVLTMSGDAVDALQSGNKVSISIDLKPALDNEKLEARLLRDFTSRSAEPVSSVLRGILPREMIAACLSAISVLPNRTAGNVTSGERKRLKAWLKDFRLEIKGYRPFEEAIITAGGVSTREVDPQTMESLLVKGLFFAGEVLDIQANTGGYNLQAAFSTGWLAGYSVSRKQ